MSLGRSVLNFLLGRRLANQEHIERKITAFEGVPAMGLDGLGSSAYGPEAALTVLIPLGVVGLSQIGIVMLPILVLLGILYVSYRQTIQAYPSNGGAYTVSKENLGTNASLLAAAALTIDYILNVAVGISAGVGALTSALPSLHPYTLWLCLAVLLLVTILNLRGTLDAGRAWALPTYLFVASFMLILAIGVFKAVTSGGHPHPVVPPAAVPSAVEAVGIWLLLKSFAAGCTAMTGVEAVSNGVSALREPVVRTAHRTLTTIVTILGVLLAGIGYLAYAYQIGAMDQTQEGYQSVLSQLAGAVVGRGVFYYVAIGSALCVLCLSANTSFVDFPRVCRLVAEDDFLPRPFAVVGRRLVFSVGILYLAVSAGILLVAFGGITDRLIPLFAIGAFLTFTMSQAGMVAHWRRELRAPSDLRARHGARASLAVNLIGAVTTGVALIVIVAAKYTEGAWITMLVIPCVIILLLIVKRYYAELDAQLRENGPIKLTQLDPPIVLITTQGWNRLTDQALQFALRLSPDVVAVHFVHLAGPDVDERKQTLRQRWAEDVEIPTKQAGLRPPQLILLDAEYRRITGPLLQLIRETERDYPDRLVTVLVPEIVKDHWWQYVLHTHRARRVRAALLRYGPGLVVITIPWHLQEPRIEEGLEEQELRGAPSEKPKIVGTRS